MIQRPIRGVVRGRTIELSEEPGCQEGQIVEVELRSLDESPRNEAKVNRSQSDLTEEEWDAWEATMAEIVALRKQDKRPAVDLP